MIISLFLSPPPFIIVAECVVIEPRKMTEHVMEL
jgi:hypothetical protein